MHTRLTSSLLSLSVIAGMLAPSIATAQDGSYDIDFVLTAYYSPLDGQCCYVKGSLEADKILNGNGTHGADGTPVYPGMVAAPPSYKFGTRVVLPGVGTMTVHDRGGAIQEIDGGKVHRIDVWAGHGEEGLARALAFGVRKVRGKVYPPGMPQPTESFSLQSLAAPTDRLKPYVVTERIIDVQPKLNDRSISVSLLQEALHKAGYFQHSVTGLFGEVTKKSLTAFIGDMGLAEPGDRLTETTAVYLQASAGLADNSPIEHVTKDSNGSAVMAAKRTLRFLGYYRGRTTPTYDDALKNAIMEFQKEALLIGDATSPGAGTIGPKTKAMITKEWRAAITRVRAERILFSQKVESTLREKGMLLEGFLEQGSNGNAVKTLQRLLVKRGLLPDDKVTGNFGEQTKAAVIEYQMATGLIKKASDTGAGRVGPGTLAALCDETIKNAVTLVRSQGWIAL